MGKGVGPPKEYVPYQYNPNIRVVYELKFKKDTMINGTKFKRRYDRDVYQFLWLAHHIGHDTTWVDAYSMKRGSRHSIRIEDIQKIIKPKRSRVKKGV